MKAWFQFVKTQMLCLSTACFGLGQREDQVIPVPCLKIRPGASLLSVF